VTPPSAAGRAWATPAAALGVGLIGAGGVAVAHARGYQQQPGVRVVALCGTGAERGRRLASELAADYYTDYRELLARSDLQAVSICSPPHVHREHALAAARSGRHILLEKPMCPTLAECDEVIAACREHGVQLMVGQTQRFIGSELVAKSLVERGEIGRPVLITDVSVFPAFDPRGWFWTREISGGGILMSSAVHRADRLRWLLGTEFDEVHARLGTFGREVATEDAGVISLRFASGALGSLVQIAPPGPTHARRPELVVYGTDGTLVVRMGEAVECFGRRLAFSQRFERDDAWAREIEAFVRAIREGREPPVGGQDGRAAVAFVLAAYRSAAIGQAVRLEELERGEQ
jgi:predicted dehydrogenase